MSPRGTHKWVRLLWHDQWLTIMEVVWRGGSVFKNCWVWIIAKCLNFWTFYVHTDLTFTRAYIAAKHLTISNYHNLTKRKHASPIFQHATGRSSLCSFRVSSLNASACTSCLGWSISMHPSRYISAMAAKELPSVFLLRRFSESWYSIKQ